MHKASEHWPMVAATFEPGAVEVQKDRYGMDHFSVWMDFAYQVTGETYGGRYRNSLAGYSQEEANDLLQSFRQGPLYIRYRSAKPKEYVCDPFRDVRP